MNFGQAIEAMKQGHCLQREGWNGKGMHVYMENHFHCLVGKGGGLEHDREYAPCLVLFTAQGNHQPGWNASTPDMLAEDWHIVGIEDEDFITGADLKLDQIRRIATGENQVAEDDTEALAYIVKLINRPC